MWVSKLLINNYFIEIQIDRGNTEEFELAMQIPYVHKNRINTKFKTSVCNLELVLKLFRNCDTIYDIKKLNESIYTRLLGIKSKQEATNDLLLNGPKKSGGWLYKHQHLGVEIADINHRYAFFYDTRTRQNSYELTDYCK